MVVEAGKYLHDLVGAAIEFDQQLAVRGVLDTGDGALQDGNAGGADSGDIAQDRLIGNIATKVRRTSLPLN